MNISTLTTVFGLVGSIAGGAYFVEDRYAKNIQVAQLEQKLEGKIASDQLYLTQERIWQLEDRLKKNPNDEQIGDDLRRLKESQRQWQDEVKKLIP